MWGLISLGELELKVDQRISEDEGRDATLVASSATTYSESGISNLLCRSRYD